MYYLLVVAADKQSKHCLTKSTQETNKDPMMRSSLIRCCRCCVTFTKFCQPPTTDVEIKEKMQEKIRIPRATAQKKMQEEILNPRAAGRGQPMYYSSRWLHLLLLLLCLPGATAHMHNMSCLRTCTGPTGPPVVSSFDSTWMPWAAKMINEENAVNLAASEVADKDVKNKPGSTDAWPFRVKGCASVTLFGLAVPNLDKMLSALFCGQPAQLMHGLQKRIGPLSLWLFLGCCGEFFRLLLALASWRAFVIHQRSMTTDTHVSASPVVVDPETSVQGDTVRRHCRKPRSPQGPYKQAWLRVVVYSSCLLPCRKVGALRVSGLRGARGLGCCWRSSPLRTASARDTAAIQQSCLVLRRLCSSGAKAAPPSSFHSESNADFMNALAQLSSQLAGGTSAATRRKRREREEREENLQDTQEGSEEPSLSSALLEFLAHWQNKTKAPSAVQPPAKKSKSQQKEESLIAQLQTLLGKLAQQNASDEVVVKRVQDTLLKSNARAETVGPETQVPQKITSVAPKDSGGPQQQKQNHAGSPAAGSATGPISLNASEWTKAIKLISKATVTKAVQEGGEIDGNVVVVKSEAEAQELKALWNAASRYDPLTVLLLVADCKALGGYNTKVSVKRGAGPVVVQDVTVIVLGDTHAAPWARQASKVEVAKFAPPAKVTVRISAPYHYRVLFRNEDGWDQVKDVLAEIGKWKICQISQLTGGSWRWSTTKDGHQLVGHLRVTQKLADALVRKSGERGIMITLTNVTDRPEEIVHWVPKKDSDDETYFRAAAAAAAAKGQGLKYRIGKGSDLGFVVDGTPEPRALTVQAQGIPKSWEGSEVTGFFEAQGWKEVFCIARKRHGKKDIRWIFKGFPPLGGADSATSVVWQYCDKDDPRLHIHVSKAPPKGPKASEIVEVRGPPKKFFLNDTKSKPSENKEDVMNVDEETSLLEGEAGQTREAGTDAANDTSPAFPEADEVAQAMREGWVEVNQKGNGDCAFRSIAAAREYAANNKLLTETESKNKGAMVRVDAISHLRRHIDRYLPNFAPDKPISPESPAVQPEVAKNNFGTWLTQMESPQAWADGLVLLACAVRYGQPIVVWYFNQEGKHWKRATIAPDFSGGYAKIARKLQPITLLLKNEHFTWLKPPEDLDVKVAKRSWLRESIIPERRILQGAAPRSGEATPSLHSLKGSCTPSVHTAGHAVTECASDTKPRSCAALRKKSASSRASAAFTAQTAVKPSCDAQLVRNTEAPEGIEHLAGDATPSLRSLAFPSAVSAGHGLSVRVKSACASEAQECKDRPGLSSVRKALGQALLKKRKEPPQVCYSETIAGDLDNLIPKKYRIHGKKTPQAQQEEAPRPLDKWEWPCFVCGAVLSCCSSASLSSSKKHHMKSRHPEIPLNQVFPSKKKLPATPSSELPQEARGWSCPICQKGLPAMSTFDRLCAIAQHCKDEHPEETPSSLHHKRLKGWKKPASMKAKLTERLAAARTKKGKDEKDDHVRILLPKPKWDNNRGSYVYCRNCLAHLQRRSPKFLKVPCKERLAKLSSCLTAKHMKAAWWKRLCKEDPEHKQLLLEKTGWTEEEISKLLS